MKLILNITEKDRRKWSLSVSIDSILQKLASAKFSDIVIPLLNIESTVLQPPEVKNLCSGMKVGTHLPGVVKMGSFYHWNEKPDFYFVHNSNFENSIGLYLVNNSYQRIFLEVPPENGTAQDFKQLLDEKISQAKEARNQ